MSSILKTDTINEKTTNNGLSINGATFKDGLFINKKEIGTGTVASDEVALLIGGSEVTGTLTIDGDLVVI
jgi:hypothetical protein